MEEERSMVPRDHVPSRIIGAQEPIVLDGIQGRPPQRSPAICTCKCKWEAKASKK